MGLLDKLLKENSQLSKYNGDTPTINPLASKQSKLHANDTEPGYSLDGAYKSDVNNDYVAYDDGYANSIPQPSILDRGTKYTKYSDVPPEVGARF